MTTQGPLPPRRGTSQVTQQETPLRLPSLLVLSHWGGGSRPQVELGLSLGGAGLWPQAKPRHSSLGLLRDTPCPLAGAAATSHAPPTFRDPQHPQGHVAGALRKWNIFGIFLSLVIFPTPEPQL